MIYDLPPYLCYLKTCKGQAWTLSSSERRQQEVKNEKEKKKRFLLTSAIGLGAFHIFKAEALKSQPS